MKTTTTTPRRRTRPRSKPRPPKRRKRQLQILGLPVWRFILLVAVLLLVMWVGFHFTEIVSLVGNGLRESPNRFVDLLFDGVIPVLRRLLRGG